MPAIKIAPSEFKIRFLGTTNASRVNVPNYIRSTASAAVAGSNFMFFDLSTGTLVGQLILDRTIRQGGTGKNLDAITLDGNGGVHFHDESSAHAMQSNVIWSMAAGPIIVRDGAYTTASLTKYSASQLEADVARPRIALGVTATGYYVLAFRSAASLSTMAGYMKQLGCTDVITGDGGSSAQLYLEPPNALYGTDVRSVHVVPVALTAYTLIDGTA